MFRFLYIIIFFFSLAVFAEARLDAKQLYLTGIKSFSSGEYKKSAACFSEFISRYHEEPQMQKAIPRITYFLACSFYNYGDMSKAIDEFENYLKLAPEGKYREDTLFRLASAYQNVREIKKAEKTYETLLKEFPDFKDKTDVKFQIAVCKLMREKYTSAIPLLEKLSKQKKHPEIADSALAYLIRCLYMTGKYTNALEKIKIAAGKNPPSAYLPLISSIAMSLGDMFYEEYDYENALDAYHCVVGYDELVKFQKKKLREINKKIAEIKNKKSDSIVKAERLGILKSQISKTAEISKEKDAGWYLRLGRCLYDMDLLWEAAVAFREMKENFPTNSLTPDAVASLVYCYAQMGFYDEARKEIDNFLEKYPNHPKAESLAFLKAESYINQENFPAAEKEFKNLLKKFPNIKNKDRAEFYLYLAQAMQEKFEKAREGFVNWKKHYKKSSLKPNVDYWLCMTIFFSGDYSNVVKNLKSFVKKYPESSYKPDVEYRIGAAYYMLEDYDKAAKQLARYIDTYTNHQLNCEAKVLYGDALAAMGKLPHAIAAYSEVGPRNGPYYHYAVSQIGKCCKMMEDYKTMAEVYEKYVQSIPDSPNVVDGLYQLGWSYLQLGKLDAAREAYWNALTKFGNKPDWSGFGEITHNLYKLYSGSNGYSKLENRLNEEINIAREKKKLTLGSRLAIALVNLLKLEGKNEAVVKIISKFTENYPTNILGADALIFLAREELSKNNFGKAKSYLNLIVKKYPENPISAEAELRLAQAAVKTGDIKTARKYLNSAEQKAENIKIVLEIALEKAQISLADNMPRQAIKQFENILANRAARGPLWPKALFGIASAYQKIGEYNKAIPYYQRIYVMYAAYTNLTAKAYYNSGICFEKLGKITAATNTFSELLADKRLEGLPEIKLAKNRMKKIGNQ